MPIVIQLNTRVSNSFQSWRIAAGDVILVYSGSGGKQHRVISRLNVIGQRILASVRKLDRLPLLSKLPRFSHVMLGIGPGLIIHADGKSVAVEIPKDALRQNTDTPAGFRVYRRKSLSQDNADTIAREAMRYYRQRYTFLPYFRRKRYADTTQFCSRLVAHSFALAGTPIIAKREANKVLPIDLAASFADSPDWQDITGRFFDAPPASKGFEKHRTVAVPGQAQLSEEEVRNGTDRALSKYAQVDKETIEVGFKAAHAVLTGEAQRYELVALQFRFSKMVSFAPQLMNEIFAAKAIEVLKKMDALLGLSRLPAAEVLIRVSVYNSGEPSAKGPYVDLPGPSTVRELQIGRETIKLYDDLISAKIALFTILAHRTILHECQQFRAAKSVYADQFLAALPAVDVSAYENDLHPFQWIESEQDRITSKDTFGKILRALKEISTLRNPP